jgi:hypothetical protein
MELQYNSKILNILFESISNSLKYIGTLEYLDKLNNFKDIFEFIDLCYTLSLKNICDEKYSNEYIIVKLIN